MTSLFVSVEGSKHQVRHNIGVWALDTVRLCVSMEGGTALGTGDGGALCFLLRYVKSNRLGERDMVNSKVRTMQILTKSIEYQSTAQSA